MKIYSNHTYVVVVCALSVFGVLTVFHGEGVTCMSTVKHECSVCLL